MRTNAWLLPITLLLALPDIAAGQALSCDMKLSVLEASLQEGEKRIARVLSELTVSAKALDQLEDATFRSAECPENTERVLADERKALGEIDVQGIAEEAAVHLRCTQFFSARIEKDLVAAAERQKSDAIVRLSQISKRILAVDAAATEQGADAIFLTSKLERLLSGIGTVERNCTQMDSIYE